MKSYRTVRTSVILVAVGDRVEAYPSIKDIPPKLREKLIESTSGDDAATILIADRKGREAVQRLLRKETREPRTPRAWLPTWGAILLCGAAGLALWLLATWR